ncbi:MAG: Dam family site-specific DNA-(adenine-N6)-methyltransferase [Acidobacteriota bacterium]
MPKIYVPPIKCQGIKTKLVSWIIAATQGVDYERWIEPFMGSGVVGFNLRPQRALFCDRNVHLIGFYNAIKTNRLTPTLAGEFLEDEGAKLSQIGEAHYYSIRDRFNKTQHPLDFLFLNRACFNGVIRFNRQGKFNVPFGHKPNRFAKSYITKIVNQIKYVQSALQYYDWEFRLCDFKDCIKEASESDLIYCDPPYAGRHTDYYNNWSEQDEMDLSKLLKSTRAKFLLSTWHSNQYRENPAIHTAWKDFSFITREHFYYVGASERNRNPMIEALVLNYSSTLAKPVQSQKPQYSALNLFGV